MNLPVYVLTSNLYLHCLKPFCFLFNKFWGSSQKVTMVGYDKLTVQVVANLPPNFSRMRIGKQSEYTWSEGVMQFLDHIEDEIFILLLEDYFLSIPVIVSRIEAFYQYMQVNPDVVKIDLTDDRLKVGYTQWPDKIGKLPMIQSLPDALFQTSLQAAIWRKDFMRRYLEPSETPWAFEKKGTVRVIADRRSGAFEGVILGSLYPQVQYINAVGGTGTMPNTWAMKRFPQWMIEELKGML